MPLYALVGGQPQRAVRGSRAACVECGGLMIAKCGDKVVHHWAHAAADPACSSARESVWHLEWKAAGIDGTQEVTVGARRADVLAPGGWAVEFQASPMTAAEVHAREDDWARRLVWVMDAREQYARGQIEVGGGSLRWAQAPERVRAARCPMLVDLDGEKLFYVAEVHVRQGAPFEGRGMVVPRQEVVGRVVRGERTSFRRNLNPPGVLVYGVEKADWCRFVGGELYCVARDACRNPNHKDPFLWPPLAV